MMMNSTWKLLLTVSLLVAVGVNCQQNDYEYEEKPVVRQRPARGPIIPRINPKQQLLQKTTTTTTTTAAPSDEEYDYADEEGPEETPQTTTTEAPKKGGIRGGVVRPFRSNTDLIEALKRRRAQQAQTGGRVPTHGTTSTEAPYDNPSPSLSKKPSKNSRFSGRSSQTSTTTSEPPSSEQPPRTARLFNRGRRP